MTNKVQFEIGVKDNATKAIDKIEKKVTTFSDSFKSTFGALAGYDIAKTVFGGFVEAGKNALKLAGNLESTRTAFTKLGGSAEKANKLIKDLENFASATPFQLTGLEETSKKMLGMGFQMEQIVPMMSVLGDAVSAVGGNQDSLDGVVLAISQMAIKGKVSTEEMLQMSERGLPVFDILQKKLNLTAKEMGNLGNAGIKSGTAISAILEGLNEKYSGMMKSQSETFNGMMSNATDIMEISMRKIGEQFLPQIKVRLNEFLIFWQKYGSTLINGFVDGFTQGLVLLGKSFKGRGELVNLVLKNIGLSGEDTTTGFKFEWKNLFEYITLGLISISGFFDVVGNNMASALIGGLNDVKVLFYQTGVYISNQLSSWLSMIATLPTAISQSLGVGGTNNPLTKLGEKFGSYLKFGVDMPAAPVVAPPVQKSSNWKGFFDKYLEDYTGFSKGLSLAESQSGVQTLENNKKNLESQTKYLNELSSVYAKYEGGRMANNNVGAVSQNEIDIQKLLNSLKGLGSADLGSSGADKAKKAMKDAKEEAENLRVKILGIKDDSRIAFTEMSAKLVSSKTKIVDMLNGYKDMKENLKSIRVNGTEELAKLGKGFEELKNKGIKEMQDMDNQISEINKSIKGVETTGIQDIAKRSIEAQKELDLLKEKGVDADLANILGKEKLSQMAPDATMGSISVADLKTVLKLQDEINLAFQNVGYADVQKAKNDLERSGVQIILDRVAQEKIELNEKILNIEKEKIEKQKAHAIEIADYQILINNKIAENKKEIIEYQANMLIKKNEILSELEVHKNMVATKKLLDDEYFATFGIKIKKVMSEVESLNSKMQRIQAGTMTSKSESTIDGVRADGGPVGINKSYLVGERGPEIFTPRQSGNITPNGGGGHITINMGGIIVQKEADENRLVKKIQDIIRNETRLSDLGYY